MFILPLPEGEADNLRFALVNRVAPAELERLKEIDLNTLFTPGVSSTGSGYGMTVVADFVANAYGFASRRPDRA